MIRSPLPVLLAGTALIIFAIYMDTSAKMPPLPDDAPLQPAILYFELAENRAEVEQSLRPADANYRFEGEAARDCDSAALCMRRCADHLNKLDSGLLILYPLFFLTVFAWLRGEGGTLYLIGILTVPIMLIGDVLENARLFELTTLLDQADAGTTGLDPEFERVVQQLTIFTRLKWGAIFAACLVAGGLYALRVFAGAQDDAATRSGGVYGAVERWLPVAGAIVFILGGALGSFALLPGERGMLPLAMLLLVVSWLIVLVHAGFAWFAGRSQRKAG